MAIPFSHIIQMSKSIFTEMQMRLTVIVQGLLKDKYMDVRTLSHTVHTLIIYKDKITNFPLKKIIIPNQIKIRASIRIKGLTIKIKALIPIRASIIKALITQIKGLIKIKVLIIQTKVSIKIRVLIRIRVGIKIKVFRILISSRASMK